MRYSHHHRHFLSKFSGFALIVVVVFVAWFGFYQYFNSTINPDQIVAKSILKEKTFDKRPQEIKTASGLTLWLIEDHTNPIISLNFMFQKSGKAYDVQGKSGLASLAAELLSYGAGNLKRESFQETLELNGIQLYFSAQLESFSGSLVTPSDNQKIAYTLLHKALSAPLFEAKDLKIAQMQVMESLKMQTEKPQSVLGLAFSEAIFGNHPYGRNPLGRAEDIMSISSEDLQRFIKTNLAKDNLIISIAGDITAQKAKQTVEQIFSFLPDKTPNQELMAPQLNVAPDEKNIARQSAQMISQFAAYGTTRLDKDFYPLYIANYIFGGSGLTSRLSLRGREKEGLTYGVYTYLSTDEKAPLILGQFSSTPENFALMRQIITEEWLNFAAHGATSAEFEAAKRYLLASYNLRFNSIDGLAEMLTSMQEYKLGLDFLQKRNDYIRQITLDEVNQAAKKYFSILPMEMNIGTLNNNKE